MSTPEQEEALARARSQLSSANTFWLGDEQFGVRSIFSRIETLDAADFGSMHIPFADDGCGNYFLIDRGTEEVLFWDHETDETIVLAPTLYAFTAGLRESPKVELAPGQVISAWIDPELLEEESARENPESERPRK